MGEKGFALYDLLSTECGGRIRGRHASWKYGARVPARSIVCAVFDDQSGGIRLVYHSWRMFLHLPKRDVVFFKFKYPYGFAHDIDEGIEVFFSEKLLRALPPKTMWRLVFVVSPRKRIVGQCKSAVGEFLTEVTLFSAELDVKRWEPMA